MEISKGKILVVEDEKIVRELTKKIWNGTALP